MVHEFSSMQGGPLDAQHIRGENKMHDTQLADQPLAGCKNRGIAVVSDQYLVQILLQWLIS